MLDVARLRGSNAYTTHEWSLGMQLIACQGFIRVHAIAYWKFPEQRRSICICSYEQHRRMRIECEINGGRRSGRYHVASAWTQQSPSVWESCKNRHRIKPRAASEIVALPHSSINSVVLPTLSNHSYTSFVCLLVLSRLYRCHRLIAGFYLAFPALPPLLALSLHIVLAIQLQRYPNWCFCHRARGG